GLSNPIRLQILELIKDCECTVNQIVSATRISQSSVSQHLACLKGCGLVTSRQAGKYVYYKLTTNSVKTLLTLIDTVIIETQDDTKKCQHHIK
ncbi:transcriptional regulator, partial [Staphylococcus gallinarum]